MDITAVIDRVRGVAAVRADSSADRSTLEGGLRSITVVRSWLASAEADLSSRLAQCASFPERAIAEAGRGTQNDASRVLERSGTLDAVPALAGALDDGSVTAAHVDAVTRVAKGLDGAARVKLLERADRLVGVAKYGSVSDFRKRLEREAESLRADDGTERFERQKKAARLRHWTDADGMWCLSGKFDPMTGVRLNARLQAEIEAAFAQSVPEGCPTDPQAKSEFLAACALAGIVTDGGTAQRAGRPEFVVVIEVDVNANVEAEVDVEADVDVEAEVDVEADVDADEGMHARPAGERAQRSSPPGDPHAERAGGELDPRFRGGGDGAGAGAGAGAGGGEAGGAAPGPESDNGHRPSVDWGLPVEIPWSVLIELFGGSDVYPVIVRNGVVLYAPGQLNLGRSTRLANRAQRRALRALYATCGVPGCGTHFDRCKIHHVVWWRHGGRTDLENLLPLCVLHHTRVHRDGWIITLGPGRMLTLRLPDGTVRNTGPPSRRAA